MYMSNKEEQTRDDHYLLRHALQYYCIAFGCLALIWVPTCLFSADDEYLEFPQDQEVTEGEVATFRCVHKFGWSYSWRSNARWIAREDSKVCKEIQNFVACQLIKDL